MDSHRRSFTCYLLTQASLTGLFNGMMLNTKSPKLGPTILERFPARPVAFSLNDAPTMTK